MCVWCYMCVHVYSYDMHLNIYLYIYIYIICISSTIKFLFLGNWGKRTAQLAFRVEGSSSPAQGRLDLTRTRSAVRWMVEPWQGPIVKRNHRTFIGHSLYFIIVCQQLPIFTRILGNWGSWIFPSPHPTYQTHQNMIISDNLWFPLSSFWCKVLLFPSSCVIPSLRLQLAVFGLPSQVLTVVVGADQHPSEACLSNDMHWPWYPDPPGTGDHKEVKHGQTVQACGFLDCQRANCFISHQGCDVFASPAS